MPWLAEALDPRRAAAALGWNLPPFQKHALHIRSARVLQRKPSRRAVIAYEVGPLVPSTTLSEGEPRVLVGKTRARGLDVRSYRTQRELVERGFAAGSDDGISVPAPLGMVPEWRMWVQALAPGERLDRILPTLDSRAGQRLMVQVARTADKLHRAGAPTDRVHTVRDELRILARWFRRARTARPDLSTRIAGLFRHCVRLGRQMRPHPPVGVHRDLHPGQLVVDQDRVSLLDLDLYALGDAGLDYGNFTAHLTELALRLRGDATAFATLEDTVRAEGLRRNEALSESHLRDWHLLSLARHVGLSTALPGREMTTDAVLEHCERLVREGGGAGGGAEAGVAQPGAERRPGHRPGSRPGGRTGPRPVRHIVGVLALALVALAPGTAAEAQLRHDVAAGVDVSSVFDSNVNRDPVNAQGIAGVVTTGMLRYRVRGSHDLRTEYEIGLHQYDRDTPWNRVSHKLRADARRPVGEFGTLGLVTEYQIRGSGGEDRSLGDQFSVEPSYRRDLLPSTEMQVRLVSRFPRNRAPGEGEQTHIVGVEVTHEVSRTGELALELRYERTFSESGRRDFHGPRIDVEWTQDLSEHDEVRLSLGYRDRSYLKRIIDTGEGEALRHDTRGVPGVRWRRDVGGWMRLSLEYEYEARRSNDPDKNLGGHLVVLGAQILR